jgi:D-glycero-beta-D-manno-heptose-7-phosphate kinase
MMFGHVNILVIGDAMVDTYIHGQVHRMSPEANVPVVDMTTEEHRLGGAANVALNLKAMGATVFMMTGNASDQLGNWMVDELIKEEIVPLIIVRDENNITTQKIRIYNDDKYLMRCDREKINWLSQDEEQRVVDFFKTTIEENTIDVVLFQDYNKGFLTKNIIVECMRICKTNNVKTAVDPKKENFFEYKNASLFKPNIKELKEALALDIDPQNTNTITSVAEVLRQNIVFERLLLTRSEHGASMIGTQNMHIEAHQRNIIDVSGAGDTVISMAAMCLAADMTDDQILMYSNLAGGLVCEYKGVVVLDISRFETEIQRLKL